VAPRSGTFADAAHVKVQPPGHYTCDVSRDEVCEAVLAFLDQFIARGAAPDVTQVREQLAAHPEARRLLDAQLSTDEPSEREAFDAMTAFLAVERERIDRKEAVGPDAADLVDLISWTRWESVDLEDLSKQQTGDPAQWDDWLTAVGASKARTDAT
jgi:hypothetical protein